jgi:hypothetical protein
MSGPEATDRRLELRRSSTVYRLVITGAPRTKKNHGRRVYSFVQKRTFNVPSESQEKWAARAAVELALQWARGVGTNALEGPVEVTALIYRDKLQGDLVGYLQAVGDVLEQAPKSRKSRRPPAKAGIIENDRQIVSWDGSRLLRDAANPRIELWIREVEILG